MLDAAARAHLGVPVRLAVATRPVPLRVLTRGERRQLDGFTTEARRREWVLGRTALKALCDGVADTSSLTFPHPRLSLTHAGGAAVALRVERGSVTGAGVDLEPCGRRVVPALARFFLSPLEAAAVGGDAGALLRLWTVKEALFKATPENAEAVFVDYRLVDASTRLGTARRSGSEEFRYVSVITAKGMLTVAVCVGKAIGDAAV